MSAQQTSSKSILWLVVVVLGLAALAFWAAGPKKPVAMGPSYVPVLFADLPNWQTDQQGDALVAFQTSCEALLNRPSNRSVRPRHVGGVAGDWHGVCEEAVTLNTDDHDAARRFFEQNFTALKMVTHTSDTGFLTGYYEPVIEGSFEGGEGTDYPYPLYQKPPELVSVNLGQFRSDLNGRRIAGQVVNGQLVPFADRAKINQGELANRDLELVWVKDRVAAFFLHIQGSGRIKMPDGSFHKVGYSSQNGHVYKAIGAVLRDWGELAPDNISMGTIRQWLDENPERVDDLLHENPSYIFFRSLETSGPVGSQGVVLTPGRSLAVDRRHIPLSAPIYLSGTFPDASNPMGEALPFNRLVVAQDTGGAIRGEMRGDVFWGMGEDAEIIAGHMQNPATFFMLLPNALAARLVGDKASS